MIDIQSLAEWSAPREVPTKFGPRILRKAAPTDRFSAAWKTQKAALKAEGAGFGKSQTGEWELTWWQKIDPAEAAKREAAKEASRQADSDFRPPAPEGREFLPFQRAGVSYAIARFLEKRGCLIADEQGLGKTVEAIGVINAVEDIKKVLIVCPNTLKINWRDELKRWLTKPLEVAIISAGKDWNRAAAIQIVNYDLVHKLTGLAEMNWDLRILDESHATKNAKTIRTKATLSIPARYKLSLTGTPILNRPVDLWTTLSDLDPGTWDPKRGFFAFAKRYCGATRGYGGHWDFSGASNTEELQDRLRSSLMIRRLKSQVLTELPAKRRSVIELPTNGAARLCESEEVEWERQEDRMRPLRVAVEMAKVSEDPEVYRQAVEALRAGQGAAFAEMAKLRHDIGMAKLPKVIEFCREAVEGGKLVIFAHHIDVVAGLVAEFEGCAVVTGETPADKRQGEVERFQNDPECRVFVGNLAAAEGITLTASSHVVFAEGQWVPGKLAQMEDRCHRIGQRDSVLVSYLVLEGSLDARMLQACVDKLDVIDRALDKEHGDLEYATTPAPRPKSDKPDSISPRRAELDKLAETITDEDMDAVHAGLRRLAGSDHDHASQLNGVGFSKVDCQIGHELAGLPMLTRRQASLGFILCRKYGRQLGAGPWSRKET